jgi:hypothetical protein
MALSSILLPFTENGRVVGARLCNFTTASSEPLAGHKDWITKFFAPAMKKHPNAWIDFIGYASRVGNAASNLRLSEQRVAATEAFIKTQYPTIKVNLRLSKGEEESASFGDANSSNDGYWRAVLIRWYGIPLDIPNPVYPPDPFASPLMYRVYGLVPTAESWRAAADRVLVSALRGLTVSPPNAEDLQALALVNRCFKLNEPGRTPAQVASDIEGIRRIFDEIRSLFSAIRKGDEYLHDSPGGHDTDNAYTFAGHWKFRKPADGIWYVKTNLEGKPNDFIVDATMHECAHFVGPIGAQEIGHAKVGGSPAYGKLAFQISRADCLKNASSYAWLAYLARMPSSVWLTAD